MPDSIGPTLLSEPAQILYDLIPLPDSASVLALHAEDRPLFQPGCTRFVNIQCHAVGPQQESSFEDFTADDRRPDLIAIDGVLPWLLPGRGQRASAARIEQTIGHFATTLSSSGVLAISFPNRFALDRLRRNSKAKNGDKVADLVPMNLWSIVRSLRAAGLSHVDAFAVVPNCTNPKSLISLKPLPSRDYYAKELVRLGDCASRTRVTIYRLLLSTGLIRYLQPHFLLWARR